MPQITNNESKGSNIIVWSHKLSPYAIVPMIDSSPKIKFFLIGAAFLPRRPQQNPKVTKTGIWLAGPKLMLSNRRPNNNPEVTPEISPFSRDHGRSHNRTQQGETPKRESHFGLVNVNNIDINARKNAINLRCIITN